MYYKHGHTLVGKYSPEYQSWRNMLSRCLNSNTPNYKNYGGRGITVCDRWQDFSVFVSDVGCRPSPMHSIDRINNDGNYEPGNVRWATKKEQLQNQRRTVLLTLNGETHCIREWSRLTGISHSVIRSRIARGWPIDEVLDLRRRTPQTRKPRRATPEPEHANSN